MVSVPRTDAHTCWTRSGTSRDRDRPTHRRPSVEAAGSRAVRRDLDPGAPDIPAQRPNIARPVFLDAHTRDLYADWPSKARAVAGSLRLVAGRYPQDAALHTLLAELSAWSEDFASM